MANLVDQQDGAVITIGYGRYGADQTLEQAMAVDDVVVILEGRLSVSWDGKTATAGIGEIIHMTKGAVVKICSHEQGAVTCKASRR